LGSTGSFPRRRDSFLTHRLTAQKENEMSQLPIDASSVGIGVAERNRVISESLRFCAVATCHARVPQGDCCGRAANRLLVRRARAMIW
jgi:hypothetical protein